MLKKQTDIMNVIVVDTCRMSYFFLVYILTWLKNNRLKLVNLKLKTKCKLID